ncbi:MAG: hypothetical protein ACI3VX_03450 [Faecousia sp.]
MGGRGASSGIVYRVPNYNKAIIADNKITKFCLDPSKKHYAESVNVGYRPDNPEQLRADLLDRLSKNEAESTLPNKHGDRSFAVYMELGVTKKKLL